MPDNVTNQDCGGKPEVCINLEDITSIADDEGVVEAEQVRSEVCCNSILQSFPEMSASSPQGRENTCRKLMIERRRIA